MDERRLGVLDMTMANDTDRDADGSDILSFLASHPKPNALLSLIVWLLPHSKFKLWALRKLGNHIGNDVVISPTIVLGCGPFWMADETALGLLNTFRSLRHVRIGTRSQLGNFNYITAQPGYQEHSDYVGFFIVEEMSGITSRHYLDCGGQIILRRNSGIGGLRSIFQSHEIDLLKNETGVGQIILEENSMTGTGVIMLKGAVLPEKSVLAAGSVLTKAPSNVELQTHGLYAGAPARFVRELSDFAFWDREVWFTAPKPFDDTHFKTELTKRRTSIE
jgi:acetyltransferase-like isoleucine patch superfamily enzyme